MSIALKVILWFICVGNQMTELDLGLMIVPPLLRLLFSASFAVLISKRVRILAHTADGCQMASRPDALLCSCTNVPLCNSALEVTRARYCAIQNTFYRE